MLAKVLLERIDAAIDADGGAKFRQLLKELLPKMEDAYRGASDPFRSHQGASGIGGACARELQLKWRWVKPPAFPARIHRLFNRGHLEEARFLALLLMLDGVQLWYETPEGGQIKWSLHGGHYGSALDGVALGIPEIPNNEPCYTEFKTASDKKFKEFTEKGCHAANPVYYVQCQQCMEHMKLNYTLFMVVNKNDDSLYAEIIAYNPTFSKRYTQRARDIIFTTEPLPRISNIPTYWSCKFCDVKSICHGVEAPVVNCRTCEHWSANERGGFSCATHNPEVDHKTDCMKGCEEHIFEPSLLPAFSLLERGYDEHGNQFNEYRKRDGTIFAQGPSRVTSPALIALMGSENETA